VESENVSPCLRRPACGGYEKTLSQRSQLVVRATGNVCSIGFLMCS
jgi:hypothetical protein